MNQIVKASTPGEIMETVLIKGDLSKLTVDERNVYYFKLCESVGLNPLTQPIEYINLNGKLRLYAKKDCTDQLRSIHKISVTDMSEAERDGIYVVTSKVANAEGRTDMAKGAVNIKGLTGENLANAIMKAECVPLDSEILTRDGFKKYAQIVIGEDVLAYDCGADSCVWTPLLDITTYEARPVVRLQSTKGQFSVICTPDHSWAIRGASYQVRSTGVRKPRGPYSNRKPLRRLVKACEINKMQSIILAAPENDLRESLLTPIESAILGWAVTDGTIKRVGNYVAIGICQSKEENFHAIRELVGNVAKEAISPARSRTFPSSGRTYETLPQHWWYLPVGMSRPLLQKAGFKSRADLPRIVTQLSAKARAAMLQAFMLAEGDKRHVFANGDPFVMDAFEILCALQGVASGSLKVKDTIWTKRLKLTRHVAGAFLTVTEIEPTPVWCPTTAFGTWVMRQNGRVMITGNTKSKRRATLSICGLGILDETEVDDIPASQKAPIPSPPRANASGSKAIAAPVAPFSLSTVDRKFPEWADEYRGYIALAANLGEIQKWDNLNATALDAINNQTPALYLAIDAAVAKRMAELGTPTEKPAAAKPAVPSPASIDEAIERRMDEARKDDPITSGVPPKAKRAGLPDIETEYDSWFSYVLDSVTHSTDGGALETFFNDEVEAFRDKIFPSDMTDLAEAYGKAQARLNADE